MFMFVHTSTTLTLLSPAPPSRHFGCASCDLEFTHSPLPLALAPASRPTPLSQPSGLATCALENASDELLDTEENPSRLQRAGSPTRSQRPGILWDGCPAGGVGVGKDADGERGICAHRTFLEDLSMMGAQFLDLVVSFLRRMIRTDEHAKPARTSAKPEVVRVCVGSGGGA